MYSLHKYVYERYSINIYLLFLLYIIILKLFIPDYFRGSVIGEGGRYLAYVSDYRPPVYFCKYNYIKNVK